LYTCCRGLKQFSAAADISATLQALGSLPVLLQTLVLDGLVPLGDTLLGVVVAACPRLQTLHVIDKSPSLVSTTGSQQQQQQQEEEKGDVGVAAAGDTAPPVLLLAAGAAPEGGSLPHPLQQLARLTSLTFEVGGDAANNSSSSSAANVAGEGGGGEVPVGMERQVLAGEEVVAAGGCRWWLQAVLSAVQGCHVWSVSLLNLNVACTTLLHKMPQHNTPCSHMLFFCFAAVVAAAAAPNRLRHLCRPPATPFEPPVTHRPLAPAGQHPV
jgi:hypothetical protein